MSDFEIKIVWLSVIGAALGLIGGIILLALFIPGMPLVALFSRLLNGLFALDTVQSFWYVTRAAGLIAYLLLWLSTAWGLAVSSKIFDALLHRAVTYDLHQFISLLAIGFAVLHVVVLLGDQYLPFSIAALVIPFIAPYRPIWVGIGIIGFDLTVLVTVTFYLRRWIGQKTFRVIHLLSFLAYAGVTVHGLLSGTDSALVTTQVMYAASALVIVFLTVYWLALVAQNKFSQHPVQTNPSYRGR